MMFRYFLRYLIASFSLIGIACYANEANIAVAANFTGTAQKLGVLFQEETGHHIKIASGATGKFFAQIQNGAPFDVLLAADQDTPARIEQEGFGVEHSRFTYATGTLVLWSAREGKVDSKGAVLQKGEFHYLAIANPKLAPYGQAAIQTLDKLRLSQSLKDKLVQGENIGQTHQFIASGNADLGFVALSQVYADGKLTSGSAWIVPESFYQPLHQDAILLKTGQNNPAARAFLDFLKTERAKKVMQSFGYHF